jgi:hypothetical protein
MKACILLALLCLCGLILASPYPTRRSERQPLPHDQTCTLCQFVVHYAEDYLEQNATEQAVMQFLEGVCLLMPSQFRSQCQAFVEHDTKNLIALLIQKLPPNVLCSYLGICPKHAVKPVPLQSGQYCLVCKLVVQAIDGYLKNDKTIAEIQKLLDSLCALLPSNLSGICVQFVNRYLGLAIQWIINTENPIAFCTQIGMCQN